jgi:predicted DNA-binding protein (MmcQ/YjbR family)
MNIEELRDYCLAKPATSEGMPFDDEVLVFKVGGKIFALVNINKFESINLKCDPDKALELRAQYPEVKPGYHMSKKHWNTVEFGGNITTKLLKKWIDDSYFLIAQKLPLKTRRELGIE